MSSINLPFVERQQNSEVGSGRVEVGRRKSEGGSGRVEVGRVEVEEWKWKSGSGRVEVGSWKPEYQLKILICANRPKFFLISR
jgi:hypothetical protein